MVRFTVGTALLTHGTTSQIGTSWAGTVSRKPHYIRAVDLGSLYNVDEVVIDWTGKAAGDVTTWFYKIQYATDSTLWDGTVSYTTTDHRA